MLKVRNYQLLPRFILDDEAKPFLEWCCGLKNEGNGFHCCTSRLPYSLAAAPGMVTSGVIASMMTAAVRCTTCKLSSSNLALPW